MALKGKRTVASKIALSTGILVMFGILGFIVGIFWTALARVASFEGTGVHELGKLVIIGLCLIVGVIAVLLVWPDQTPEQKAVAAAAKAEADRRANTGLSLYEEEMAKDAEARAQFMAQFDDDDHEAIARDEAAINADWGKVADDFNSGLAQDLRRRKPIKADHRP